MAAIVDRNGFCGVRRGCNVGVSFCGGPLHGIPIALKDNVHTTDIRTTGGALAFRDLIPPYDATLTKNLRDGGAVIIAKTVLTELAHWTAGAPTPMVANYTGVAGFAYNPYDPRMDPRDETFDGRPVLATGGSSSGAGTAASFWAASVGSDTGGSIISPSNANMLVGIRPTIGRISRYGVIPITADHDTAGPMARTVRDAAVLMGVLESAGARSERRRHQGVHAAGQPRLHRVPRRRRAQRRAHRRAACLLHRSGDRAGREDAARRPQSRSGQGDGRGHRAAEGAGRRGRRSGRRAEHRRDGPGRQLPALRLLPGRRAQEGRRRQLHGELQVRDEARLQRLAGQPRPGRAGEDADRAAAVEPRACQGRCDALRPVAPRHLRRDGRGDATRRATTPTSPRTTA